MSRKSIYIFIFLLLEACTNVEPWERERLAKNQMRLIPNTMLETFTRHVNYSREGTEGGYGLEGGGCGCN
jgi:hypothetical protein